MLEAINRVKDVRRGGITAAYNQIDSVVGGGKVVDLTSVYSSLADSPASLRIFRNVARENGIKIPSPKQIEKGARIEASFLDSQLSRSDILEAIRKKQASPDFVLPSKAVHKLGAVGNLIDEAMETAARDAGGEGAVTLWRNANGVRQAFASDFENNFVRALLKSSPEQVGESLFKIKRAGDITNLKRIVDPETMSSLKGAYLAELFNKAKQVRTGVTELGSNEVTGRGLKRVLGRTSPEVRKAILGEGSDSFLKTLSDTLFVVQERQPQQAGTVAVRLAQFGAIVGLATGAVGVATNTPTLTISSLGSSGIILLGPIALSRLMSSRAGQRIIIEGMTSPPTREHIARVTTRMLTLLGPKALGLDRFDRPPEEIAQEIADRALRQGSDDRLSGIGAAL